MADLKRNTTFRLDADLEARIEAIRDAAARRSSGPFATRPEKSTVLRALLEAGAKVYEAELGIARPKAAGSSKAQEAAEAPARKPKAPKGSAARRKSAK
jgi:hypothetical protein